jgi:hypothetical protein
MTTRWIDPPSPVPDLGPAPTRACRTALGRSYLGVFVAALALAACAGRGPEPRIADIYREAALEEVRNPVIVIHGILGARLEQRSTGKVVWGAFTREGVDPGTPEGAQAIALPLEIPASAAAYAPDASDVYATGPLDKLDLTVLFRVVSVDVYARILQTLGAGGYRDVVGVDRSVLGYADDHYTCFSFFYDWRRDNVENAIRFDRFLKETRAGIDVSARARIERLRASGEPADLEQADRIEAWLARGYRFDVVAHSMGGLIARYYLRYGANDLPSDDSSPVVTWAGAEEIDRLLLVGAPSFGSLDSLQRLVEGYRAAFFLPEFGPGILGTMPSIYQLLPRDRHRPLRTEGGEVADVSLLAPQTWRENEWGLLSDDARDELALMMPDVDEAERLRRATDYQAWCLARAAAFHRALDAQPTRPCPAEVFLFAGDAEPTVAAVSLRRRSDGALSPDFRARPTMLPGDGTVARYSALADERVATTDGSYKRLQSPIPWTGVTFLPSDHVGLTSSPTFSDNTLHLLLERPPRAR